MRNLLIQELCQDWKRALIAKYNSAEIENICNYLKHYLKKHTNNYELSDFSFELNEKLKRLLLIEPVQYVFESAPFLHLDLQVDCRVLIPRPETEEWVNYVIRKIKLEKDLRMVEIGTGSGCISIAIKTKLPSFNIIATDISEDALNLARENAKNYQCDIEFVRNDFLHDDIDHFGKIHLLISNPPYIAQEEIHLLGDNVIHFEPALALFADPDPLVFYRKLLELARHQLLEGGFIFAEINELRAEDTFSLFEKAHLFSEIEFFKDFYGKPRMIHAKKA